MFGSPEDRWQLAQKPQPQGDGERRGPPKGGAFMGMSPGADRFSRGRPRRPADGDQYGSAVRNLVQPPQPQYASSQGAYPQGPWQQGWPR